MANYKEQNITGTAWVRCSNIIIENPHVSLGKNPFAMFREELIVDVGDGTYNISPYNRNPNAPLMTPVVNRVLSVAINPTATFDLYDPTTGQKTGTTMTHAELYAILYSAYRTEAEKSDAAAAAAAAITAGETPVPPNP